MLRVEIISARKFYGTLFISAGTDERPYTRPRTTPAPNPPRAHEETRQGEPARVVGLGALGLEQRIDSWLLAEI